MTWLTKLYNSIKEWKAPFWLKSLIQELNDLMIALIRQITKDYLDYLKSEIIFAAGQNWTSEEKFNYVFKQAKKGFTEFAIILKDSELRLVIEFLVNQLKKREVIN